MLNPFLGAPLAFLYGLAIDIRHKLFDLNLLRSEEYDIPIVCVGNITVGGTGKTPVTEYLIEHLATRYRVAVLSRGYKRKTKGFVLATVRSSFRQIGDEPKQIKLKYPEIPVAVCEKRTEGIRRLREAHPEVNLIILDDAFQHRYVEPWVNIVLMDYNNPVYRDHLLPWGTLRDRRRQLNRAHFVLVTKCPPDMNPLDMRLVRKSLDLYPYQSLYFTRMKPDTPLPLFPDQIQRPLNAGDPVMVLSGIANPNPFIRSLSPRYKVVGQRLFEDHHLYRTSDLEEVLEQLSQLPPETKIMTTEKDAVKLTNRKKIPVEIQRRLYYLPIRVHFVGGCEPDFLRQLEQYVISNQKYHILHPE